MNNQLINKTDEELMAVFNLLFEQHMWHDDLSGAETKRRWVTSVALEIQFGGYPITMRHVRYCYDRLVKKGLLIRKKEPGALVQYATPNPPDGCTVKHVDYFSRDKHKQTAE